MSLTFGFTSKKRPTVVYMNYKFNQYSKNNKGCIHWRCVEYVRFKCRAKLVTFENKMLENSAPLHTHPANKSDVAQKCANDAHEQQACDSFQVKAIEKQDKLIKHYSVLSSPSNSNGTNAEENENELQALYNTNAEENENDLQALYNTLSPADNYNDLAETSDEEFYKRWNASTIEKGAKSQRFRKNRVAKPESVASKLTNFNAKSAASKTLLRTKNDLRGLRKNSKLNNKCSRKVKWLDY
jgi:FLYWCH zinc finger domain